MKLITAPSSTMSASDRVALTLSTIVGGFVAVLLVGTLVNGGGRPDAVVPVAAGPSPVSPATSEPRPKPKLVVANTARSATPACSTVGAPTGAKAVTCKSATATLHLAGTRRTVDLEDLSIGVTQAVVRNGQARVSLWARNTSDSRRLFNGRGQQVYLSLGGRRVVTTQQLALDPGKRTSLSLKFTLPASVAASPRSVKADLGVVPFAQATADKPASIGVVRVALRAAASRSDSA